MTANVGPEASGPIASPLIRIAAFAADVVVVYALHAAISILIAFSLPISKLSPDWAIVEFLLVAFVYFQRRTLGQRLFRIAPMSEDGRAPTFAQHFTRTALLSVDVLLTLGLAALISMLVTSKHQRLGDLAAKTLMVKTR